MNKESKEKALKIARFLDSRKAEDISILDLKDASGLCDYFVICSATSTRHVDSLRDEVVKEFRKTEDAPDHWERDQESSWILVDFFNVILHIFLDQTRAFYNLEYLWSDAKKIPLSKNKKTAAKD